MAHAYHHLYGMNIVGLRFFTVYGPFGRPDMGIPIFAEAIEKGETIKLFGEGALKRDFTFVDDIAEGVLKSLDAGLNFEIINLGGENPVGVARVIELLEKEIGKKAKKEYLPMQPGDVFETAADISRARELLGWEPKTDIEQGVREFVIWFKKYYHLPSQG